MAWGAWEAGRASHRHEQPAGRASSAGSSDG